MTNNEQIILEEISDIDRVMTKDGDINFNSFSIKDKLNPDIFKKYKLKSDVRKKIMKVANSIIDDLKLPDSIVTDIILVGSIVSYHYSSYSDLDIHIIVDMKEYNDNIELVRNWLNDKRILWNIEHEVTIEGYDAELYFQDVEDEVETNGTYSVMNDEWINVPQMEDYKLDTESIKKKALNYIGKIDDLSIMSKPRISTINKLWNKIVASRQSSLKEGGEFSEGNIIFKILRRTGHIDVLRKLRTKASDKKLSSKTNEAEIPTRTTSYYGATEQDVENYRNYEKTNEVPYSSTKWSDSETQYYNDKNNDKNIAKKLSDEVIKLPQDEHDGGLIAIGDKPNEIDAILSHYKIEHKYIGNRLIMKYTNPFEKKGVSEILRKYILNYASNNIRNEAHCQIREDKLYKHIKDVMKRRVFPQNSSEYYADVYEEPQIKDLIIYDYDIKNFNGFNDYLEDNELPCESFTKNGFLIYKIKCYTEAQIDTIKRRFEK